MIYADAVRALYALGNEVRSARLGLDRIRAVLSRLGDPQTACRFVHVAGTNGKGSVCAMIEAGLRATGVRTGLYTSPHLVEPVERIQIAGQSIARDEFARAFSTVHEASLAMLDAQQIDMHPTYFETVTAMAFFAFREHRVETVALEVGLGGRLDATNVVMPELCVITAIDYDHQNFLGDTIELIAAEKAGILKRGVPAVFSRQKPAAEMVLMDRARELDIHVEATNTWGPENVQLDADGSRFRARDKDIVCPLAGEHQVENALTAAVTLVQLGCSTAGIANARWPGRLERVNRNPEIILDGAHNIGGAQALASWIRRSYNGRRIWMVFGAMSDKNAAASAALLFSLAHRVIATAADNVRALPPDEIRAAAPEGIDVTIANSVPEAIHRVREEAANNDVVFITGSLYVIGEARRLLVPGDYVE
jgi:dihydrofolate synthase/folylpolyglutamate synthase